MVDRTKAAAGSEAVDSVMTLVERFDREQLAEFRDRFGVLDAETWDEDLDTDAAAGRLDALADGALADHAAGRTRSL